MKKDTNIIDTCTYFKVDISKATMELRDFLDKEIGLDPDTMEIVLDKNSIDAYNIPLEFINWESEDLDEDELEELLYDMIGKFPHYLVFAQHCTWNGASGYMFCEDIKKTVYRTYDASIYYEEEKPGCLKCTESSHDVPGGQPTYIIGLSEKEYNKLKNSTFEDVEKFALSKF